MLRICLFGRFAVYDAETAVAGFASRRVQELFSYLLLQPGRAHPRESLATLLWQDLPTAQSKKYLRHALWQLQHALEGLNLMPQALLTSDLDWLQVDPTISAYADVTQFQRAYTAVRGIRGQHLTYAQYEMLIQATSLYRGDLLEGWYHDWCIYPREQLQNMYLAMLDKLMGFCEAHQAYEEGIQFGARILHIDIARERTHRRLMRLHYLAGDRTAALRQYQSCTLALRQELNVAPARSTVEVYEQIRADDLHDSPYPTVNPTANLNYTLLYLQQIQNLLGEFQTHVAQQIQTVQRALAEQ